MHRLLQVNSARSGRSRQRAGSRFGRLLKLCQSFGFLTDQVSEYTAVRFLLWVCHRSVQLQASPVLAQGTGRITLHPDFAPLHAEKQRRCVGQFAPVFLVRLIRLHGMGIMTFCSLRVGFGGHLAEESGY